MTSQEAKTLKYGDVVRCGAAPRAIVQRVLPNGVIVSYDGQRGEPRGPHKKGADWTGRGDCIDCNQCVVACPMGIDIRMGQQLECIHCGLCAEACLFYTETGNPKYTPIHKLEPMRRLYEQEYTLLGRLKKTMPHLSLNQNEHPALCFAQTTKLPGLK